MENLLYGLISLGSTHFLGSIYLFKPIAKQISPKAFLGEIRVFFEEYRGISGRSL